MTEQTSIGDWIRSAYEGSEACPPPETYLAEELAELAAPARERLEKHAESCAACAAELELARAFEAADSATASERREIDRIARRLERRPPHRQRAGWLGSLPSWAALGRSPAFQLAAVLVLLIGVGFGVRNAATPPPLVGGPGESGVRSSQLEVVAPVGEIAGMPRELSWRSVENASEYRLTIRAVDDEVLWSDTTTGTELAVDEELAGQLRSAVTYVWTVEAVGDDGTRIAWSADARFHISPAAGESQ